MTAYYNEIDPYCAKWLENLIAEGQIADGIVDRRSIQDVHPSDLTGFTQCHFFAGIGTWSLALRRAGWIDTRPVWTGSCPCQPFSTAGKGDGFSDPRHLWPDWYWLLEKHRPEVIFGEQVASKDGLAWLDIVHADLERTGYAVAAVDYCAAGAGAHHIRQRLFFVGMANPPGGRFAGSGGGGVAQEQRIAECRLPGATDNRMGDSDKNRWEQGHQIRSDRAEQDLEHDGGIVWLPCRDGKQRPTKPGLFPVADGVANRVAQLRAYGNGIHVGATTRFIEAVIQL